jgi:hypothetical protein
MEETDSASMNTDFESGERARPGRGCWRLAGMNFSEKGKDCFGETPKPTPETGVLPGNCALRSR